jgi:hypothetical protein
MDEIVIVSDHRKASSPLAALIRVLFPECDVHIVSKRPTEEEEDDCKGQSKHASSFANRGEYEKTGRQ